jgi:tetratricopeptide (TPR) repeat protein
LGNIGTLYKQLKQYDKALEYALRAVKLAEEMQDKTRLSIQFGNLGLIYNNLGDTDRALEFDKKALVLAEELNDQLGVARQLSNMGVIYSNQRKFDEALRCHEKSLEIRQKLNARNLVTMSLANLGELYSAMKNYKKGEAYLNEALQLCAIVQSPELMSEVEQILFQLYSEWSKPKEALIHYKKYIALRDSLFSEESTKNTVRAEMNFEFDKKEAAARLEQEKKEAISAAESKKQKIVLYSICATLVLVMIFAVYAYRNFLEKKRTNKEITRQKHIIEEKQKEIVASIYYAKRIQQSLLMNEKTIERNLNRLKDRQEEGV